MSNRKIKYFQYENQDEAIQSLPQRGIDYNAVNLEDFLDKIFFDSGNYTSAIGLPNGTTAQRPSSPLNGDMRYNSTTSKVEVYENGAWKNFATTSSGLSGLIENEILFGDSTGDATSSPDLTFDGTKLTTNSLQLTGGSGSQGTMNWNTEEETVDVIINNDVTYQIGHELAPPYKNQTGSDILNGTPVMFAGSLGASGRIKIQPAIADGSLASSYIVGITTKDIPNGEDGQVTWFGKVRGIQTNGANYGETWNDGDILYVSASNAGYLTKVKPSAPNLIIEVAAVENAHATNGTLFVRPTWNPKFVDLTDVNGTPLTTSGQIAVWDQANGYFDFTNNINDYLTTSTASSTYLQISNNLSDLASASTARTNLGLEIGVDVQAYASDLQNLVDNYTVSSSAIVANNNFTLTGAGTINIGTGIGNITFEPQLRTYFNNFLTLNTYGSGAVTGTAAYYLAVDSSGNIIEESTVGFSVTGTDTNGSVITADGSGGGTRESDLTYNGGVLALAKTATASDDAYLYLEGGSSGNSGLLLGESGGTILSRVELGSTGLSVDVKNVTVLEVSSSKLWDYKDGSVSKVGYITLKEKAAAGTPTASYGELWVKTGTPNTLWFTDDAGTDHELSGIATGSWLFSGENAYIDNATDTGVMTISASNTAATSSKGSYITLQGVDVGGSGLGSKIIHTLGVGTDARHVFKDASGNDLFTVYGTGTLDMHNNRLTNLADPTFTQDAATKNYVDTNAGTSGLLKTTITVDAADVATLNSTPIDLLAAPGVGFYYHVHRATFKMIYNSSTYVPTTLRIGSSGASNQVGASGFIGSSVSKIWIGSGATNLSEDMSNLNNQALQLYADANSTISGNSDIEITIYYTIESI